MKRNILLSFLLLGLIVLEYGCAKEPMSCSGSSEMTITGFREMVYLRLDSSAGEEPLTADSVAFDELLYGLVFDWERIASNGCANYSAYAVTAPFTRWKPDSISIVENEVDVTAQFKVNSYESVAVYLSEDQNQNGNYMYFSLKSIAQEEQRVFTFKLYDKNGEVYEITSKALRVLF